MFNLLTDVNDSVVLSKHIQFKSYTVDKRIRVTEGHFEDSDLIVICLIFDKAKQHGYTRTCTFVVVLSNRWGTRTGPCTHMYNTNQ